MFLSNHNSIMSLCFIISFLLTTFSPLRWVLIKLFFIIISCKRTNPMRESLSEAHAHAIVGLKELVGEVLCEESEHEVGALGVGSERPSLQQLLNQHLRVRQQSLA